MEHRNCVHPFDTIESAQEFIALLRQSLQEALDDVQNKLSDTAAEKMPSHVRALELANFKLNQLRSHIISTERLLKDLRTLRDLLGKDANRDRLTRGNAVNPSIEAPDVPRHSNSSQSGNDPDTFDYLNS
jgi:hypothetical protein